MKAKGFWLHENGRSACVYVHKVRYRGPHYRIVKIQWCGLSGFALTGPQTVKVPNEWVERWTPYEPDNGVRFPWDNSAAFPPVG